MAIALVNVFVVRPFLALGLVSSLRSRDTFIVRYGESGFIG